MRVIRPLKRKNYTCILIRRPDGTVDSTYLIQADTYQNERFSTLKWRLEDLGYTLEAKPFRGDWSQLLERVKDIEKSPV